jgi:hypothetical protein
MNIKFNKFQLDRLSEYISNISLIFFATIITPLFSGAVVNYSIIPVGMSLSISFLVISLLIIKK